MLQRDVADFLAALCYLLQTQSIIDLEMPWYQMTELAQEFIGPDWNGLFPTNDQVEDIEVLKMERPAVYEWLKANHSGVVAYLEANT